MSELKYVNGRIITRVDPNQKNAVTFSDGTEIALVRDVENFDKKYTSQVLGVVMSAENIPTDAIILFHHNSVHETYEVLSHSTLSGEEIASGIKIYSIMERDCFFWKMPDDDTWQPTKHFATALRVFRPYTGFLIGIEPTLIKDTLFVTSGKYAGLCCRTIEATDYCITFRDPTTGKDENIIRFRPEGDDESREPELTAIDLNYTELISEGRLLVGLSKSDAKPIEKSCSMIPT